ncbi:hypothetical protein WJX74_006593 [Apatococcus lobatus]|uniref:Uncharacterized protein n=1 Tax=Apatococcus lobatus TaxID=904363 RepID=A0AAW1RJ40_9CHLO
MCPSCRTALCFEAPCESTQRRFRLALGVELCGVNKLTLSWSPLQLLLVLSSLQLPKHLRLRPRLHHSELDQLLQDPPHIASKDSPKFCPLEKIGS